MFGPRLLLNFPVLLRECPGEYLGKSIVKERSPGDLDFLAEYASLNSFEGCPRREVGLFLVEGQGGCIHVRLIKHKLGVAAGNLEHIEAENAQLSAFTPGSSNCSHLRPPANPRAVRHTSATANPTASTPDALTTAGDKPPSSSAFAYATHTVVAAVWMALILDVFTAASVVGSKA
eukprot:CAMPEP_0171884758 /NCGR_PEP_ID=MMETSP0992-20121227/40948_1 /TAXON_ID=483369 /ORGANISM="non described non described, Strain CCMP2098" /LENGTH=175 /DNA_ID=CAMNT_0012511191 /DNA_START=79 /DNA_END=606 /DNA_ORIENTATION=+